MKNRLRNFLTGSVCFFVSFHCIAQEDTTHYNYGIWQTFGEPVTYPEVRGRLCNFRWADLEMAPNIWHWTEFDSDLAARAKDSLPIIFMIYTEEDAPGWLYTNGVPKVAQRDSKGNLIAYCPYYADTTYKKYFKRMIDSVHDHVEHLPVYIRNHIIAVQGCFGSTGDYIGYKGAVDPQYDLSGQDFFALFQEFSQYYYDAYKNTSPKIYLLSNPKNNGSDQYDWLIANLPGSWVKTGTLGKGYQLNDEVSKSNWLYSIINSPQAGNYVRARSEIIGGGLSSGWWNEAPYKNMFTLLSYCIFWGVDWSNQSFDQISDPLYDSAFSFYNKYAGQKDAGKATNAMCMLHDGLDASDGARFPVMTYGTIAKTTTRFNNILQTFIPYGAKLEDPSTAILNEMDNLEATGINDVGWGVFEGNYDRYLHEINANNTSQGYWNVQSTDLNTMYGRFARGFNIAKGKNFLYFDVDSSFLHNAPLNGQYPVMIEITYLDTGTGKFQLCYDAVGSSNKPSTIISCNNTGLWKKASITLNDAYFGNRSAIGSDFYIKNVGSSNVIFSVIELTRPDANSQYKGYSTSGQVNFDTICVNGTSASKSFTLKGSFLSDSITVIKPLNGFVFSTSANGPYDDSIILKTGATFYQAVYVKYKAASAGAYQGNITVTGGGVNSINIPVSAFANDKTVLSANVSNVTCYNAKDGSIDLTLKSGTGPFNYSWTSIDGYTSTTQNITGLIPSTYTVTISSAGGCTATDSFEISQPDDLVVSITADPMICKGGTTKAYVTATGGTMPYTGTDTFTVGSGSTTFTVTDAHGCVGKNSISVADGTLQAPSKPISISSPGADAMGLCKGGNFDFSVGTVATATSYIWQLPSKSYIVSADTDSSHITVNVPSDFVADSISVIASNACGTSLSLQKNLIAIPAKPTAITGPSTVALSQQAITYSITPVAGLTYIWTVPGKAVITGGQNTSSITVDWGITAGKITVKALNNCGSSAVSTLYVNVINGSSIINTSLNSLPSFDTLCINGLSSSKSFNLTGSHLDGTDITVGPTTGYKFSSAINGTYTNSLTITGYDSSINQTIYVKFNPSGEGNFNDAIVIEGGGASSTSINVNGIGVNSSPLLEAAITNVSCNGMNNGAIDLSLSGGIAPFSYNWSGVNISDPTSQDINGLSASNFIVTVTSSGGCRTSATYVLTQPDTLVMAVSADPILCKNGTTTVHVNASGGAMPYIGTGDVAGIYAGTVSYTVTDANGCSSTGIININNGTIVSPASPSSIRGDAADATGLCGGGYFSYEVNTVATATSYTWTLPTGCSIASANTDSSIITIHAPSNFDAGILSVAASNSCGVSIAITKTLKAVPSAATAINGPDEVTANEEGTVYSVQQIPGLDYSWKVPEDAVISSGNNTSSITVNWGIKSGDVGVTTSNACGNSASTILSVAVDTSGLNDGRISDSTSEPTIKISSVTLMPNPVKATAYLTIISSERCKYSVSIYSVAGKALLHKDLIACAGNNNVNLDVHNFANGVYIVSVFNEKGQRKTIKLVKE